MDVSRETPDVTTKPKCYDLTSILPHASGQLSVLPSLAFEIARRVRRRRKTESESDLCSRRRLQDWTLSVLRMLCFDCWFGYAYIYIYIYICIEREIEMCMYIYIYTLMSVRLRAGGPEPERPRPAGASIVCTFVGHAAEVSEQQGHDDLNSICTSLCYIYIYIYVYIYIYIYTYIYIYICTWPSGARYAYSEPGLFCCWVDYWHTANDSKPIVPSFLDYYYYIVWFFYWRYYMISLRIS